MGGRRLTCYASECSTAPREDAREIERWRRDHQRRPGVGEDCPQSVAARPSHANRRPYKPPVSAALPGPPRRSESAGEPVNMIIDSVSIIRLLGAMAAFATCSRCRADSLHHPPKQRSPRNSSSTCVMLFISTTVVAMCRRYIGHACVLSKVLSKVLCPIDSHPSLRRWSR